MKYWLDTEFIAHPFTIDLVSIGLVAENGREFHAESSEASCQGGDSSGRNREARGLLLLDDSARNLSRRSRTASSPRSRSRGRR